MLQVLAAVKAAGAAGTPTQRAVAERLESDVLGMLGQRSTEAGMAAGPDHLLKEGGDGDDDDDEKAEDEVADRAQVRT